jgi:hypothetical protein
MLRMTAIYNGLYVEGTGWRRSRQPTPIFDIPDFYSLDCIP